MIETGVFVMCIGFALSAILVAVAQTYRIIVEARLKKRAFENQSNSFQAQHREEEHDLEKRLKVLNQRFGVPMDRVKSPLRSSRAMKVRGVEAEVKKE